MVNELIAQLFERETDRALDPIPDSVERKTNEAVDRGVLGSGMYVNAVHNIVIAQFRELVNKRVEIEKDVWQRQGKTPVKADGDACKEAIGTDIERVTPRFFKFIEDGCRRAGQPNLITHQTQTFKAEKVKFLEQALREVDIWVGFSAIEPKGPMIPPVSITYRFENYGIFQTGSQSQAIVVSEREQDNQWIIEGLSQVREDLAGLKELQDEQKGELIGAVETAIAEVKKGKPNPLTIGGIITAVGSATSVLANATKAYETIKLIAGRFGVTLP
ncbi:MAG: hypothetical protein HY574_01890 [candidate division NC10 bacterium]|nr:hypothetical protein [candidate division NC10 bacterium]